jgi:hypothetical protein
MRGGRAPRSFSSRSLSGRCRSSRPLDEAGDGYLLSAHMLQHVLIGDAAPALALVALRGPLLFFLLPALSCAESPSTRYGARSVFCFARASASQPGCW